MKLPRVLEVVEWLPLIAIPILIWNWSDGLTHSIDRDLLLILGLAAFVNGAWIVFHRHMRQMSEFPKKFPGFRMKKNG